MVLSLVVLSDLAVDFGVYCHGFLLSGLLVLCNCLFVNCGLICFCWVRDFGIFRLLVLFAGSCFCGSFMCSVLLNLAF